MPDGGGAVQNREIQGRVEDGGWSLALTHWAYVVVAIELTAQGYGSASFAVGQDVVTFRDGFGGLDVHLFSLWLEVDGSQWFGASRSACI